MSTPLPHEPGDWIIHGPDVEGREQMALDLSMLQDTELDGFTRVRLYRFVPPCVSLGYHQHDDEVDLSAIRAKGYTIARRPTGGRAVLHKGDLVYSISAAAAGASEDGPLHLGVYNLVSLALIRGLRSLGIEAGGTDQTDFASLPSPDLPRLCFSSVTPHEVQIEGRKVVGSAQRRGRNAVLQHGSLLITDEHLGIAELLHNPATSVATIQEALRKRTISLREAGFTGSEQELAEALTASFREVFPGIRDLVTEQLPQSDNT